LVLLGDWAVRCTYPPRNPPMGFLGVGEGGGGGGVESARRRAGVPMKDRRVVVVVRARRRAGRARTRDMSAVSVLLVLLDWW
jgi:hypothetical protein